MNLDPLKRTWESDYATLGGNPIMYIDPKGDSWYGTKEGSFQYSEKKLSKKEEKQSGFTYLGEEFSGHLADGKGVTGMQDGTLLVSDILQEVTVMDKKSKRGDRASDETISKRVGNGTKLINYPLVKVDFEVYATAAFKNTLKLNKVVKAVVPVLGGQIGYSTDKGKYADIFLPDVSYGNITPMQGLDFRVMPLNGLARGDYRPGGRALITLATFYKVVKIQADIGINTRQLTLGGRAAIETPSEMYGMKIPYSLEGTAGARFIFTAETFKPIEWER